LGARFEVAVKPFAGQDLFFAPEAVSDAIEHQDLNMMDQAFDDRASGGGVAEDLAQLLNGRLLDTIMLAVSYRRLTSW
jgi:hypothetical protein